MANDWNITKTKHKRKNTIKTENLNREGLLIETKPREGIMADAVIKMYNKKIEKLLTKEEVFYLNNFEIHKKDIKLNVSILKKLNLETFKILSEDKERMATGFITKEDIINEKYKRGIEELEHLKKKGYFNF